MKSSEYNRSTFGFTEHNPVWEHIMFIIKKNIETETEYAIDGDRAGENRAYFCGRASALTDIYNALRDERRAALDANNIKFEDDDV